MTRRTQLSIGIGLVVMLAVTRWWIGRAEAAVPPLRPPPVIPAITSEALAMVGDGELLERIYLECLRRMLASQRDMRAGPEVLTAPACHLWVIAMLEERIRVEGLRAVAKGDRNPGRTPLFPSLEQLRDAYHALGLAGLAEDVHEVLDIADEGTDGTDPYAALMQRFLTDLGSGTRTTRLAYARQQLPALFPETAPRP